MPLPVTDRSRLKCSASLTGISGQGSKLPTSSSPKLVLRVVRWKSAYRVASFTDSLVEQWVVIHKNGLVALINNMRSLAGLNRRVIELNACSWSHSPEQCFFLGGDCAWMRDNPSMSCCQRSAQNWRGGFSRRRGLPHKDRGLIKQRRQYQDIIISLAKENRRWRM